jgi:hyperosmotically inducible protein
MSWEWVRKAALSVIVLLLSGGILDARPLGPQSDAGVCQKALHLLSVKGIENVQLKSIRGYVTLSGEVPSLWLKKEAEKITGGLPEVKAVFNKLDITRPENDEDLANRITQELHRFVFYTVYDDVNVSVVDGTVFLAGRVTRSYKAREIERLASRATGAQVVRNEINVLPTFSSDDELRVALATAIYRDPHFWRYATQGDPPIHIIVDLGRVTLTGVVGSKVDRRKAEEIARNVPKILKIENRLRVAEESCRMVPR